MSDNDLPVAIRGWLEKIPGGEWIAPHYNDGPYELVVVCHRRSHNWRTNAFFSSHDPIAKVYLLTRYNWGEHSVYALPKFAARTLAWEDDPDNGHVFVDEFSSSGHEQLPTLTDLVSNIVDYYTNDDSDLADSLKARLAGIEQRSFLEVLSARFAEHTDDSGIPQLDVLVSVVDALT